jgi:tripartite-type tricarboxylate transporter receptor subunit TctC
MSFLDMTDCHVALAGTAGVGSPQHVLAILFQRATGTRFQFVHYRGGAPAVQDLVAGQIDLVVADLTTSLPQVRAGQLKAYAYTGKTRLAVAPDIPTAEEAGLPGYTTSVWSALWAPKDTPPAVIARLNSAVVNAPGDATIKQRMTDLGDQVVSREQQTPEALAALHRAELEKWWPIIRTAGIKAE